MALSTKLKAFLKKSRTAWKDAAKTSKESGGYKNLDDGFYTAKFKVWRLEEGKDENSPPQDVRVYVISQGEHEGFQQRSWQRIDPESNPRVFEFMANDFLKLDPDCDPESFDWENLDKEMAKAVEDEPEVVIKLTTGQSGYQNTRLWRLANPDEDIDEDDDDEDDLDDDDDEDEDEDEESEDEIDVNSRVTFEIKGTEYAGVVTQFIDDDTVKVKCDDGKTRRVALDDLELEESDEDEDEDEEDEDSDEEKEVEVGATVEYAYGDETFTGKVLKVNEDEGTLYVESMVGSKLKKRWIEAEGVVLVEDDDDDEDEDDEDEEPEPEPAKPARRTRRK